ncbi:MAG: substrate-binding domain-containing protein, partial [Fusobacteriaceae bacterium]
MKKVSKILLCSTMFLALATSALAQKKFVLITMDSMDEHWLSVKKGAEKKATELKDVEILFRAPAGKVDPNEQTRMVEDAINQKVDAILLAPSDKSALGPVVERAIERKIPVVIIDSPVDAEGYVTFLSTDNYAAGAMAADTLAQLVNEEGKVGIINAQPGAGTAIARSSGFQDRLKEKYPQIKVVGVQ